jgi:hypothetical protein
MLPNTSNFCQTLRIAISRRLLNTIKTRCECLCERLYAKCPTVFSQMTTVAQCHQFLIVLKLILFLNKLKL